MFVDSSQYVFDISYVLNIPKYYVYCFQFLDVIVVYPFKEKFLLLFL